MNNLIRCAYIYFCVLMLYGNCHIFAQNIPKETLDKTIQSIDSLVTNKLSSEGGILPAPMINPSLGAGIAVVPVYVYQLKGVEPGTNPSKTQGIVFVNLSGSFLSGLKQTIYFNRNNFWLDAYVGYAKMSFNNYVNNYLQKEEIKFQGFVSNVSFAIRIKEHLFLGPIFSNNYVKEQLVNSPQFPNSNNDFYWFHMPGIKAAYDSRSDIFYPENGWFTTITYETMIHNTNNTFNFDKITFGIANYIPISKTQDMIIASRFYKQLGLGHLPLHEMASPGASSILRGYIKGDYLNSSMISLQTELRWMFAKRWGAVGFVGYGWLFDQPDDIKKSLPLPSIGAGARYRIFPEFKINLGLDAAFGRDGSVNVYFKLSEAF